MVIPFRYPLVEIMGGFFALCVYLKFGLSIESLVYYAFIASLLVITFIDIDHTMIPDVITISGIPIGLLSSIVLPTMNAIDSLLGTLVGGGILYFVGWAYALITKKEGMGGGDIKLLAMIGAFLGWKGVIFTIFIASTVGAVTGILIMLRINKDLKLAIPFGPFLSLGAIAYVFIGPELIYWYSGILV
jgi:leader peptidase (prepilin peptidase)/N-methyltransferase